MEEFHASAQVTAEIVGAIAIYGFETTIGGRPILDRAAIADCPATDAGHNG